MPKRATSLGSRKCGSGSWPLVGPNQLAGGPLLPPPLPLPSPPPPLLLLGPGAQRKRVPPVGRPEQHPAGRLQPPDAGSDAASLTAHYRYGYSFGCAAADVWHIANDRLMRYPGYGVLRAEYEGKERVECLVWSGLHNDNLGSPPQTCPACCTAASCGP